MSRFQFVADNSDHYAARGGVKRLCELVEIKRSSYYAWLAGAPARAARAKADARLAERIRAIHADDNTMGAPRVTAELNDQLAAEALLTTVPGATGVDGLDNPTDNPTDDTGPVGAGPGGAGGEGPERVNHKRVARVMREHGIRGYQKRRRVRTTIPEPSGQVVPDLLKRDFTAPTPGLRYVGDITYLPLADGTNLYLATVIDCFSRRIVGWSVADHMRTSLIEDALKAAAGTRGGTTPATSGLSGSIFHSDHGSVYTSRDYARLCGQLGVTQSIGAVGTSADNALAESFNATLKREVLQDAACWPDEPTCRRQVFTWLVRYNNRRRHSRCGYQSPSTYEAHWATTLPTAA